MACLFEKGTEEAAALLGALEPYAEDPASPYWLAGNHADGLVRCYECAEEALAQGLGEFMDGGWPDEGDGCEACWACGRLLGYALTDYGAQSELGHYLDCPPAAPLSPREAYEIAQLLWAMPDNPDALNTGRLAVAAIGKGL